MYDITYTHKINNYYVGADPGFDQEGGRVSRPGMDLLMIVWARGVEEKKSIAFF